MTKVKLQPGQIVEVLEGRAKLVECIYDRKEDPCALWYVKLIDSIPECRKLLYSRFIKNIRKNRLEVQY